MHSDAWVGFLNLHSHTSWWCPSPTQGCRVLHTVEKCREKMAHYCEPVEESVSDRPKAEEARLHTALADLMTPLDDSIQKMTGKADLVMFSKHAFDEQRTSITHQVPGKRPNKNLCNCFCKFTWIMLPWHSSSPCWHSKMYLWPSYVSCKGTIATVYLDKSE